MINRSLLNRLDINQRAPMRAPAGLLWLCDRVAVQAAACLAFQ
jgi:hypothetical protein